MNKVEVLNHSELDKMYQTLKSQYPIIYSDIWKFGINIDPKIRISQILNIEYNDISETFECKINGNLYKLNNTAIQIINSRKLLNPDDIFLFEINCNRAKNKPISRISVSRIFKECGESIGMYNINTESMRKSRAKILNIG